MHLTPLPMATNKNLRLLSFNANSVSGKLNNIQLLVATYKPDIIAICETRIGTNFDDNELLGNSYTLWRKDRVQGAGGVLIAIKNDIDAKVLANQDGPGECVAIKLQIHDKIVANIVCFYRPPSEYELDNFIDMLEIFSQEANTIFVGDYNFPDIDWISSPNQPKVKDHSHRAALHRNALEQINAWNLKQLIHEPTHKFGNTLDLVMIHKALLDDLVVKCDVLPPLSDHNVLLVDLFIQGFSKYSTDRPPRIRRNYNKADYNKIEELFASTRETTPTSSTAEDSWKELHTTINTAIQSIPKRLAQPSGTPWITRGLVRLVRKRSRLYTRNNNFPSIKHDNELSELDKYIKKETYLAKSNYIKTRLTTKMENGDNKTALQLPEQTLRAIEQHQQPTKR